MIEMRHFRLVSVLERSGTLTEAAATLGYSQSAVSQQVQTLERQLGTPIVLRTGRGVRLTPAGEAIARRARDVLDTAALTEAEVQAVAALRAGHVRLSAFPSAAAALLPRALGRMRDRYPDLRLSFKEAEPPQALRSLRAGECDIAIVFRYAFPGADQSAPAEDNGEVAIPLIDEEVRLAVAKDDPLASRRWVHLDELANLPWIAGCPDCRGNLVAACQQAGFEPDIAFETDDFSALVGLAGAGLGVALVPDLMAAAGVRELPVLRRLSPLMIRSVSAVTTEGLARVPGVRETLTVLREVAGDLGEHLS